MKASLISNSYLDENDINLHYIKAICIVKFSFGIFSLSENYYYVASKRNWAVQLVFYT